jgi:hypothetical protein
MASAKALEKRLIRLFSRAHTGRSELLEQAEELERLVDEADEQVLREAIVSSSARDLPSVIVGFPGRLAKAGQWEEAVRLSTRLASVYEPALFLTEQALILARAGRRESAIARIEANAHGFPDDVAVLLGSAEAYGVLKNEEREEELLRQAVAAAGEASDKHRALLQLERLLQRQGRAGEQEATRKERAAAEQLAALSSTLGQLADLQTMADADQPYSREKPKPRRNDPCHCGSRKKYKKCCWPN